MPSIMFAGILYTVCIWLIQNPHLVPDTQLPTPFGRILLPCSRLVIKNPYLVPDWTCCKIHTLSQARQNKLNDLWLCTLFITKRPENHTYSGTTPYTGQYRGEPSPTAPGLAPNGKSSSHTKLHCLTCQTLLCQPRTFSWGSCQLHFPTRICAFCCGDLYCQPRNVDNKLILLIYSYHVFIQLIGSTKLATYK